MNSTYNKNTNYFLRYLKSFNKSNYQHNMNIYTIRHLLEEIKTEVTFNDDSYNDINIKMLVDKLHLLLQNDLIMSKSDKSKFAFLEDNLIKKNSHNYICSICNSLLKEYTKKSFIVKIVNNLTVLMGDDNNDNSRNIKILTDYILVELSYYGYSFNETKEIIFKLISKATLYKRNNNIELNTSFPYRFLRIKTDDINDICNYINNMTIYDKLKYLVYYFSDKNSVYYLIISLYGITIKNKKVLGKGITIYNPKKISMISKEKNETFNGELFSGIEYDSNNVNVIVRVKANNINTAINNGIKCLESFFNIYNVIIKNSNIIIQRKHVIVLNNKKQLIYRSFNSVGNEYDKNELNRKMRPLTEDDLDDDYILKNVELILNKLYRDKTDVTETDRKIVNSISKYSEALSSSINQEKILKYWSCVESLFDKSITIDNLERKSDIIKKVLAVFRVYFNKYKYVIELYDDLIQDTNLLNFSNSEIFYERNEFELPKSMINIIYKKLKKKDLFSLEPLAKNSIKILNFTDSLYYKNKIEFIDGYYNDIDFARKKNSLFIEKNLDIITNCYRLRNQIIHNANSNEITTNYYLGYLKEIVGNLLFFVLKKYQENNNYTISQIILEIYSEANLFLEQSKNEIISDFIF